MMKEEDILYEDGELLVLYKEPGIPVQTKSTFQQDYVSLLKNRRVSKGEEPFVGVVHRLDQPVEGILLFAKNKRAAAELSGQIASSTMEKEYLAVVRNHCLPEEGELTDYLRKDARTNLSLVVPEGTKEGRKAVLRFRTLERKEKWALVRIRLLTGRHHQIRVQMAHAGWPLLGDRKYGSVREKGEETPLALCAVRLAFTHPRTGERLEFTVRPRGSAFLEFAAGDSRS